MKTTQLLASGLIVRQDIEDSVRLVFFETGYEGWEYGSDGGTSFVINYSGNIYALTAKHVVKNFKWEQLVITKKKVGKEGEDVAKISAVFYPSLPIKAAEGTDVVDIAVIELTNDVNFFKDSAYIVDDKTIGTSKVGDKLYVSGSLKEKSSYLGEIEPGFCQLDFIDNGASKWGDAFVREATAKYDNPPFESLDGLSGSPVFNVTQNKLSGMAIRGKLDKQSAQLFYIDIFDIYKVLESIKSGNLKAEYLKKVEKPIEAMRKV
jgi:hypothetical protein